MKREHTTQSNTLLDFLQTHNCIFYSPLSYDDTTDWISGNQIIPYGDGSMLWDDSREMWKFSKLSTQPYGDTQYFAYWNLKEAQPQRNDIITGICELYLDSYSKDAYIVCNAYPYYSGWSIYGTRYSLTQSAQVLAVENNRSVQKQYRNGTVVFSYNYNTILQLNSYTGIRIGTPMNRTADETNRARGPYWVRNLAVLTQALTLAEINEYFNLI